MTFKYIKYDIPSSIVVFLVALPLCLGIALGSQAPLLSGIVAGIVGGIVIGYLSNSNISVSGPAAGLTAVVIAALETLQSFEIFLVSVILAGIMQVVFGFIKAGVFNQYIPNSVVKGMLAAIGLILIMKQFPHAVGYDSDFEGDESFFQKDGRNTVTEFFYSIKYLSLAAIVISIVSFVVLILWEKPFMKRIKLFSILPAPLIVVLLGVAINSLFLHYDPKDYLRNVHLVNIPLVSSYTAFFSDLPSPAFSALSNINVWIIAVQLAIVASIESLLSIEAADRIDPYKRHTDSNRELKAQGIGNIVSGLLGGLPITSVIVRTSANVSSGARSKLSAILHGVILLLAVLLIPAYLNLIPLSCLAAILMYTGFKLCKPALFKEMKQKGYSQLVPFIITITAIYFTDLLIGILIGSVAGIAFTIHANFRSAVKITRDETMFLVKFMKDTSFLNKPQVKKLLQEVEEGSFVMIDITRCDYMDLDVADIVNQFIDTAAEKNITVEVKRNPRNKKIPIVITSANGQI